MFDGFIGIFKIPYQKGIKDGFSEGLKNFVFSCSSQSLFLGENVIYILINYFSYLMWLKEPWVEQTIETIEYTISFLI